MHKEQGCNIEHVIVDCDGVDKQAMFYTAASRCTRRKGLHLKNTDKLVIKSSVLITRLYEEKLKLSEDYFRTLEDQRRPGSHDWMYDLDQKIDKMIKRTVNFMPTKIR